MRVSFGDGIWAVGSAVKPGTYHATVPAGGQGCYWARAKDASGNQDAILAQDNVDGGKKVTVTIMSTDKVFASDGCGTWTH